MPCRSGVSLASVLVSMLVNGHCSSTRRTTRLYLDITTPRLIKTRHLTWQTLTDFANFSLSDSRRNCLCVYDGEFDHTSTALLGIVLLYLVLLSDMHIFIMAALCNTVGRHIFVLWFLYSFLWSPYVIKQTIIFSSCFFLLLSSSFFFFLFFLA